MTRDNRKAVSPLRSATALQNGALLIFVAALISTSPLFGATVVGSLQDSGQGAAAANPVFIPLSTPQALGTNTILDQVVRVTASTNGVFSISLVGGVYDSDFGPFAKRRIRILVPPNDTNTYQFNYCAQLAGNLPTFYFTNAHGISQFVVGAGVSGTNHVGQANEQVVVSGGGGPGGGSAGLTNGSHVLFFSEPGFWWLADQDGGTNDVLAVGPLTADSVTVGGGDVHIADAINANGVTAAGAIIAERFKATKSLVIDHVVTNQWLILSNGFIVIPPFNFPSEVNGGDAESGGIYFATAHSTSTNGLANAKGGAHYILNMVGRSPSGLGQLLLSHQDIAIEEQINGQIILGNDGTSGGIIRIRADSAFGQSLQTNVAGHSKPLVFEAGTKDSNGVQHWSYPALVAWHGLNMTDGYAGDPAARDGSSSAGELAFYTSAPWPLAPNGAMTGGAEMGRMVTNGWRLDGQVTIGSATTAPSGLIIKSNSFPFTDWRALGNSGCVTWMSNATLYLICTNSMNANATTNKLGGL